MSRQASFVSRYFKRHAVACILSFAFLVVGVAFGSLATAKLTPGQKTELATYLEMYISGYGSGPSSTAVLSHSITAHAKLFGLAYLLGLTIIGAPGVLILIFAKGFLVGFTVSFLAQEYLLRGVLLAVAAVIPHNLVALPAVIVLAINSLSFAWNAVRGPGQGIVPVYKRFPIYTLAAASAGAVLVVAALVEAYITPVFIRLVSGLV